MVQEELNAPTETRERILDAAEALFGECGFDAVSLRDITGRAGANVAAVNYHFGSKDKLIDAVVERHAVPINEGRLRMLEAAQARHGGGVVPVAEILDAFLRPVLEEIGKDSISASVFSKFMGRIMSEQSYQLPDSVKPLFQNMAVVFALALRQARPDLSERTVLWRMHYSFGVMSHTLMHGDKLEQISAGRSGDPSLEELFQHVIGFCSAGFEAPENDVKGGAV